MKSLISASQVLHLNREKHKHKSVQLFNLKLTPFGLLTILNASLLWVKQQREVKNRLRSVSLQQDSMPV